MNKKEQIEKYLKEPIKEGDEIVFTGEGNGSKDKSMTALGKVYEVDGDIVRFNGYGGRDLLERNISDVKKSIRHIGANPFKPRKQYNNYRIDIEQLFWRAGFGRDGKTRGERYFDKDIPECIFEPKVLDKDGNEIDFQRGLVWNLKQKQLLIESIYNGIEIGKFVFRRRSYSWVEKRVKEGKIEGTGFSDLIDGKQRTSALLEFVKDGFRDLHGNLYSDLSPVAQRHFDGYGNLTYVEMPEETTDEEVIEQFLAINFTGVPMSEEHIEFVKSIRL